MQLHWVIQTLFSWKDAHLHVFETEDGLSLDIDFPEYSFLISEDDWEQSAEAPMERYLSVGEVFEKSKTIQYVYDLGEYWMHKITLAYWKEDITKNSPVNCILMTDIVPPEDVAESKWCTQLDILLNSNNREVHEKYRQRINKYNRMELDVDLVNQKNL